MKKIVYTNHAVVRMAERDIEQKAVEDIIRKPDYVKTSFDGKKMAVKSIIGRIITVVYIEKESHISV